MKKFKSRRNKWSSKSLYTMYVDCANLIVRYLSIWRSDLETGHIVVIVRISRSFSRYAMNKLMHVMQLWFLGYMDDHSNHLPWLNHRCKIECLQNAPHWQSLESEHQCKNKDTDFSSHDLIKVECSKISLPWNLKLCNIELMPYLC